MGSSERDKVAPVAPVDLFQGVIDRYLAAQAAPGAAGCGGHYGERAEVQSPFGPPAYGRVEIEAEHRRWFAGGETNKTMKVTRAGIEGDPGHCLVEFEADVPAAGRAAEQFRGTSLNAMERRSDGVWTIALASPNEAVKQATETDK